MDYVTCDSVSLLFYVSHLDIRSLKSSRFKANPQDMREHEWKSNYIRTAILLLSFVIAVVKMISALKIFKVKECGQTILFNTRILRICIFTHTHTRTRTHTLDTGWIFKYLIWAAHFVRKYYSWGQGHEFKFQVVKSILPGKGPGSKAMVSLLNLSPACSIFIIIQVKSGLKDSCKPVSRTRLTTQ